MDREGLETAVLGLEFRLRTKHFKKGDMKIKCLATIATVYWKSNELSIEGERPLKIPVMESRETRAQGHTHAEHILGITRTKRIQIYIAFFRYYQRTARVDVIEPNKVRASNYGKREIFLFVIVLSASGTIESVATSSLSLLTLGMLVLR